MSSPIDNEGAPGENGTRLPALGSPELSTAFLGRMKEILESLLGRRGASNWDRAVTFRDLYHMGVNIGTMNGFGGPMAIEMAGDASAMRGPVTAGFAADFDRQLRGSAAYKELSRGIGSVDDLAMMPDEFRQILQHSLADAARENQAAIRTVERKVQTSAMSVASRLTEITAALDQAAAGVRQLDGAYADNLRALATSITQVTASLGNLGTVTVEEKFLAQADVNDGLLGQWSIKIQTGTQANPIIAGIALSSQGPTANETTSSLVFMADRFGFYTNNGTVLPFGIDGATGKIFVNGQLVVNAGGNTLDQLATGLKTLDLTSTSQIFQITKAGANAPDSITLTARASSLAGTPNWTIPAGTATLSAGASAYSKVLTFANMATDTVTVQVTQDGLTDTITIAKVREGSDSITGLLTNEAATVSASSAGVVSSFASAGGVFKLYDGTNDKTGDAAVAYSVTNISAGLSISIAATGVYSITALTNNQGSATLRAVYRGVTIDKVYTIAKATAGNQGATGPAGSSGSDGSRGNINVAFSGYSSWSDTGATNAVINAGYGYPQERDVVTLYGTGYSETKFRSGASWLTMAAYINGNMLVTGTLSASKLSGGEISGVSINIGNGNFKVSLNADGTTVSTVAAFLVGARLSYNNVSSPVAPTAQFVAYNGTGSHYAAVTASGSISLQADGAITMAQYGEAQDVSIQSNNVRPIIDNAYNCGTLAYRWMGMTSATPLVVSSDARLKLDIVDADLGLDFINALRPVSYRLKEGRNEVVRGPELVGPMPEHQTYEPIVDIIPQEGKRRHYGLIAQEVRAELVKRGADNAAFWALEDPADPDSRQALRYEELISPLIRAVQELAGQVAAQQQEIDGLKGRLLSAGL